MDREETRTSGWTNLSSIGTTPLKPKKLEWATGRRVEDGNVIYAGEPELF